MSHNCYYNFFFFSIRILLYTLINSREWRQTIQTMQSIESWLQSNEPDEKQNRRKNRLANRKSFENDSGINL